MVTPYNARVNRDAMQRDSCSTCRFWKPPAGKQTRPKSMGQCNLDERPSHPGYYCRRFESRLENKPQRETLGLTQAEIDWLRQHRSHRTARTLIRLYRMVIDCPSDPGARGTFAATLADWRKERRRAFGNPFGSAGNPAGAAEGRSYEQSDRNSDP